MRWLQRMNRRSSFGTGFAGANESGIWIGLAVAGTCLSLGVILGHGQILNFFDFRGLMIVLGGTMGATLVNYSPRDLEMAWKVLRESLADSGPKPRERIIELVRLAQAVRQDGLLVLDEQARRVQDPFLKAAMEITVDGHNPDEIKRILETEIRTSAERNWKAVQLFQAMGTFAPAMGLIGTLIGLIEMLGNLEDAATIGPAMAVALITTLYGAVLANVILLPLAGKLRNATNSKILVKTITIEGILGLGRLENPIVIEQKLQGFLPAMAA